MNVKTFFSSIFSDFGFIYLPEVDEHIVNLKLLTHKRKASEVFLITSKQFQIIAAM